MSHTPQPATKPRRTVGLDQPCRSCGRPIYFNYRGPVEGLCGRCTDHSRRRRRARPRRGAVRESGSDRRPALGLLILVLAAVAAVLVLTRL